MWREPPGLFQREPIDVQKLAVDGARTVRGASGIHDEKAGVVAARTPGRGYGAREKREAVEMGTEALGEEGPPTGRAARLAA